MRSRASQRRTLQMMELRLHAGEPKLAEMFSIFTRLAHGDPLPGTETISDRRWHSSAWRKRMAGAIVMPLLLAGLVSALVLVVGLGRTAGRCAPNGTSSAISKTGFRSGECWDRFPLRSWRAPALYGK